MAIRLRRTAAAVLLSALALPWAGWAEGQFASADPSAAGLA